MCLRILWRLEKAFVKDILLEFEYPRPAYNTVSTIVRILEKKGVVDHNAYGKTHEYYPLVTRDAYKKYFLKSVVKRYFGDSMQEMVSFFARDTTMSLSELEEIKNMIGEEIKKQQDKNDA